MPSNPSQFSQWVDNKIQHNTVSEELSSADSEHVEQLFSHTPELDIDKKAAWAAVSSRIQQDNVRKISSSSTGFLMKVAAAIVLLVVSGVITFQYLTAPGAPVVYHTVNLVKSIELPDGSLVTLNQNSTLKVAADFNESNRNLSLEGEAVFSVEKLGNHTPFTVNTEEGSIKVLGTVFNVQTGDETAVYVKEGRVAISDEKSTGELQLAVGELGRIKRDGRLVKESANDNLLYWKTRQLHFKSEKISAIVARINKQFDANITVSEPLQDCVITLTVAGSEVADFIKSLKKIKNVSVSGSGKSIHLDGVKC